MFLNLQNHTDYSRDIHPFVSNGILLDTCAFDEIVEGLIDSRVSKIKSQEFENIEKFLQIIKCYNTWTKFYITPHILTEICTHLRTKNRDPQYKQIVGLILPLLGEMQEKSFDKDSILKHVDINSPIVEVGDISIELTASDFLERGRKVAILSKDRRLNSLYKTNPKVLVLDYETNIHYLHLNSR